MFIFGVIYLFHALLGVLILFFGLFNILISPWFINRIFRDRWKNYIEKKTFYVASDINPYGMYIRTQMYAKAAVSEKYAQKTFGVSRNEFRSKLNKFQLFLCYVALSILPAIIWIILYFFIIETMGFREFMEKALYEIPPPHTWF